MEFVFAALLGLAFGSFTNVLIYRIPRQQEFVRGRSQCPHCRAGIAWYDLFPLLSWVALRGRCRHCAAPISIQYPVIELVSAIAAVWFAYMFGTENFIVWLFVLCLFDIFLALAIIDARYLILPDVLLIAATGCVMLFGLWEQIGGLSVFYIYTIPHVAAGLAFGGMFFALWYFSKGAWLGFGDVKLLLLLGLVFGVVGSITIVYAAVLVGAGIGIGLLLAGKASRKTMLPFGTMLAGAAMVALVFWTSFPHVRAIFDRFFVLY